MELGKDREFCEILSSPETQGSIRATKLSETVIRKVSSEIIGHLMPFQTCFGLKPLVYADYTASGRTVDSIEKHVIKHIIPYYGNTHTTSSMTGSQSTCYRHEARQIIAESVNAKISGRANLDVVIFCDQGTTAAVNKLILALGLNMPLPSSVISLRPVVFVSSYEHHSNLIPWKESVCDVVTVNFSPATGVDLIHLELLLSGEYRNRCLIIGSFSACSNVTGIITNIHACAEIMHKYNGLCFADYAACAPYVKIDINSSSSSYLDAIFLSGHKFIGGPGSSGILVCKKKILMNPCPTVQGGGTIFYSSSSSSSSHVYLSNRIDREEAGTPNIVGNIRTGLVFLLKRQMGDDDAILSKEMMVAADIKTRLLDIDGLMLLGSKHECNQLPIFSFLVKIKSTGKFLHYNYVCRLLNDLFGIQTRGGCQCAGPYSQELLGLNDGDNDMIMRVLADEKVEFLRPGYSRISVNLLFDEDEIDYIVNAVRFVCEHGADFLSCYRMNVKTGEFFHSSQFNKFPQRRWISHFDISSSNDGSNDRSVGLDAWHVTSKKDLFDLMMNQATTAALSSSRQENSTQGSLYWYLSSDDDDNNDDESTGLMSDKSSVELNEMCRDLSLVSVRVPHQATLDLPIYLRQDVVNLMTGQLNVTDDEVTYPGEDRGVDDADDMKSKKKKKMTTIRQPSRIDNNPINTGPCDSASMVFPSTLLSSTSAAIREWDMIQEGDKLLLGLSGGKDSMTLLHVLLRFQRHSPVQFELCAATVDPQTPSYNPSSLPGYLASLGVVHHYLSEPIIENASKSLIGDSLCAYCARMKRGLLYSCCRKFGYNKLVLGQHLDDLAESWFMSAAHNGRLLTMKANYQEASGIRVIRPLIYVRERTTRDFALRHRLPIVNENCPACFEQPKERARIKSLLAREESMYPNLFGSLKQTMMPLMDDGIYDQFKLIADRVSGNRKNCIRNSSKRSNNKMIKMEVKQNDNDDDYFSSDSIQSKP